MSTIEHNEFRPEVPIDYSRMESAELHELIEYHTKMKVKYSIIQLGKKLSLNSAYGVLGSRFGRYYDLRLAEAITLTGQHSIRWIIRKLDEYLCPLVGKIPGVDTLAVAGDTDSVLGDSIIYINGQAITIADYFSKYKTAGPMFDDKEVLAVHANDTTESINPDGTLSTTKHVKYVMRHKVKKRLFKITINSNEVTVTEDHSVIVRNSAGRIIEVKPMDLDPSLHEIIRINRPNKQAPKRGMRVQIN